MYGLKQVVVLAYTPPSDELKLDGCAPILGSTGMWQHKDIKTVFCLCVDDFGVKYHSKEDTEQLLETLYNHYNYNTELPGKDFCGLTFEGDCAAGHVDVSMP